MPATSYPCNRDVSSRPIRHIVVGMTEHPYVRQRLCLRTKGCQIARARTLVEPSHRWPPATDRHTPKNPHQAVRIRVRQRLQEHGV